MINEVLSFEEFKQLNEKKKDQQYSSGCIMGYFAIDPNYYKEYVNINEEDIYNNEENEYGIEIEPHCTVLYGLHDDEIDEDSVVKLFTIIKPFQVQLKEISLFENENFDVLKFDVSDEYLKIVNDVVSKQFPNTQTFPDYHAHCTIAYLKPGTGKNYVKQLEQPIDIFIDKWVYSQSNGRKISIDTEGNIKILRSATDIEEKVEESITYKGYDIKIKPHNRFKDAYNISCYRNLEYKLGIKGPVDYHDGIKSMKSYIDNIYE